MFEVDRQRYLVAPVTCEDRRGARVAEDEEPSLGHTATDGTADGEGEDADAEPELGW